MQKGTHFMPINHHHLTSVGMSTTRQTKLKLVCSDQSALVWSWSCRKMEIVQNSPYLFYS